MNSFCKSTKKQNWACVGLKKIFNPIKGYFTDGQFLRTAIPSSYLSAAS